MLNNKKKRIFDIIQIGNAGDTISRGFDVMIMAMILCNLFLAIFDTFEYSEQYKDIITIVETVTVLVFTVEYGLRLWTADLLYSEYDSKGKARIHYFFSFWGLIDLLAFLPFYLPFFFPSGLVAFRMFRVIRILRLFRVNAYYDAFSVITNVIKSKKDQLLSSCFIIGILIIAASLCMYSLEHEAQPDVFENAFSGVWWAVSSLLTVGYGDIYPITFWGRLFGILITFLGVGMVAIPTGILSAGFVEQYSRIKSLNEKSQAQGELDRFLEVEVKSGGKFENHQIRNMHVDLKVVLVKRGERTLEAGDSLILRAGDVVVLEAKADNE